MTTQDFSEITVPAVEGKVNAEADRIRIYTAELPASVVAHFYVEPALSINGGFQRQLDSARAQSIGKLQGGDRKQRLQPEPNVHGGLLAFASEDEVTFKRERNGLTKLTIHKPLRLIDGQHRAAGAQWAMLHGVTVDWTETVRVVVGAERDELAMWYLRANIEARKVSPANVIVNAANMTGMVLRRKSWIARHVIALSKDEPFVSPDTHVSLVSFQRGDGGRIQAQTLYRAIDIMLPEMLNGEGRMTETEALRYLTVAFSDYAEAEPSWLQLDATGNFAESEAYSFTSLVAFAHLYRGLREALDDDAQVEARVAEVLPFNLADVGSGERAAVAVASYAAGQLGISLRDVA